MAIEVRKLPDSLAFGAAAVFNAFKRKFVELETTFPHYDITSTTSGDYTAPTSSALQVTASSTADLAHVIVMAEEERRVLLAHLRDEHAHEAADDANIADIIVSEVPTATDQDSVNDLLNALSTAYTAHIADTALHAGGRADETNVITADPATTLNTSKLLAADIKAQLNAHILFGWDSPSINIVPA